jgi:hypothetical protein
MTRWIESTAPDARAICNELEPKGPSTMNGITNPGSQA